MGDDDSDLEDECEEYGLSRNSWLNETSAITANIVNKIGNAHESVNNKQNFLLNNDEELEVEELHCLGQEKTNATKDIEKLRKKLSQTSLGFVLDDDSGIGASAPNSVIVTDDETAEREENPSELPLLNNLNLRKSLSKLSFKGN